MSTVEIPGTTETDRWIVVVTLATTHEPTDKTLDRLSDSATADQSACP